MFSDVLDSNLVTSVNVDTTQSDKLLRLLDTVVIKLEGGTDEDLKVLDEKPIEHRPLEPLKEIIIAPVTVAIEPKLPNVTSSTKSGDEDDSVQQSVEVTDVMPIKSNTDTVEVNASSTKRTTSGSSSSSHSSSSSSSSDDEDSHDADEEEQR